MKLNDAGLRERTAWEAAGISLPGFDIAEMRAATQETPCWVHFGAGNIFRAFIARLQQTLLNEGLVKTGIIAAECFDFDIIDRIYAPHDNLSLNVTLMHDGSMHKEVVASVASALKAGPAYEHDLKALHDIFRSPSLQLVSFTITEKGYALHNVRGEFLPEVEADLRSGPSDCGSAMCLITSLLLSRYEAGGFPIALVSMDNCSHNGEKLRQSVMKVVEKWLENGFVSYGFAAWVRDERKVAFPWTMIDKITPRPAKAVEEALAADGVEDIAAIVTPRETYIAPFVNAERPQYLVIEDRFPNGRPPLERAGVYMSDRDTVNATERMKVSTCLNPLHTALAVFGCLLGCDSIAAELNDPELRTLVERIGRDEGLPVVADPKIIDPREFFDEVLNQRLPNPFIYDTPQRIATDTSQKVGIRFGETIQSYFERPGLDARNLTCIPLAIAGWLRYLLAVDDEGRPMSCSPDPLLGVLQAQLADIELGKPDSADGKIAPILSSATLFGADLNAVGLGGKIEGMFREMIAGAGAVRATLKKYLTV